jgi:hypothetical protein
MDFTMGTDQGIHALAAQRAHWGIMTRHASYVVCGLGFDTADEFAATV